MCAANAARRSSSIEGSSTAIASMWATEMPRPPTSFTVVWGLMTEQNPPDRWHVRPGSRLRRSWPGGRSRCRRSCLGGCGLGSPGCLVGTHWFFSSSPPMRCPMRAPTVAPTAPPTPASKKFSEYSRMIPIPTMQPIPAKAPDLDDSRFCGPGFGSALLSIFSLPPAPTPWSNPRRASRRGYKIGYPRRSSNSGPCRRPGRRTVPGVTLNESGRGAQWPAYLISLRPWAWGSCSSLAMLRRLLPIGQLAEKCQDILP